MAKNKLLTAVLALLIGCGTTTEQLRVSSLYNNPYNHWFRGDAVSTLEVNLIDADEQAQISQPTINEEYLITDANVPREIRELYNRIIPYAQEDLEGSYGAEARIKNEELFYIVSVNIDPDALYRHYIAIYSFEPENEVFQRALIDFTIDGYVDH